MRISSVSVVSSFVHLPVLVHNPASIKRFMGYSSTWWRERRVTGEDCHAQIKIKNKFLNGAGERLWGIKLLLPS